MGLIRPDDIFVGDRLRALDRARVEQLKESITKLGLKYPITVRQIEGHDEMYGLVVGRHRLQACIELGFERIEANEEHLTDLDAKLWEISENLHRAELSVLERDEHLTEWIKLTAERNAEAKAQVAPSGTAHTGGRPDRGINAAVREFGVERTAAQRAVKRVESIPAEVRDEIKGTDIANSGVQLDALTKAKGEPERQLAAVKAVKAGEAKDVREVLQPDRKPPTPAPASPPTAPAPTTTVIRPDANLDLWRFVLARITDPSDVSELSRMAARTYSEATQRAFARALAEKIPPERIKRLSSNDQNYCWIFNGPTAVLY